MNLTAGDNIIGKIIFILAVILCLSTLVSPPVALLLGLVLSFFTGHPYLLLQQQAIPFLLQVSVVGLGFGMNLQDALKAGKEGLLLTVASISVTLLLGYIVGKLLSLDFKTSFLISSGTAICGGSAIAATSKAIQANEQEISVALGTVFILNAVALLIFPVAGRALHLSEVQFGWWAALAIHDTSSVVGAASQYGEKALEVATTIKLARALWIIPLALFASLAFRHKGTGVKIPWFIGLFVLAMVANSYIPAIKPYSGYITTIAKSCLVLTVFLIGFGASKNILRLALSRPFLQGVLLWLIVSVCSLWVITALIDG